jgi:hypothetical protein
MIQRVRTNLLDDGAVTSSKIGATAITANNIAVGSITSNLIANNAVTNAKLAEPNAFEDFFLTSDFSASRLTNQRFTVQSSGGSGGSAYDANTTSTGFFAVPIGTTAQRPAASANGILRFNTTLNRLETYMPSAGWLSVVSDSYTVSFILVAGGGCGGVWHAGGGGGGGVITGTSGALISGSDSITFTIGAGGATTDTQVRGSNGSNTSAAISGTSYVAIGGGAGGNYDTSPALSGGSGGGGNGAPAPFITGASGTPGQGYSGGNGYCCHSGGGGGGAGGAGEAGQSSTVAGDGGIGYTWLDGNTYGGGGGGGTWDGTNLSGAGTGGAGGGGRGSYNYNNDVTIYGPTPGTVNTGGGGGGSGRQGGAGGNQAAYVTGGSGVAILRYLGSQRGSGGTVTSSGGYTYHKFTGTGTYTA